jgi:small-conductance mechanosensitive channel
MNLEFKEKILSNRLIAELKNKIQTLPSRTIIAMIVAVVLSSIYFGVWGEVRQWMNNISPTIGGTKFSLLAIVEGCIIFSYLIAILLFFSRLIEKHLARNEKVSPSMKILVRHFLKMSSIAFAAAISLGVAGVNMTFFHIFGGGLGVGLGLGLQRMVGNLVAGVALLFDGSIKPGNVIALPGTYGCVNFMGARYVSVITPSGKEHLIPNETLLTTSIENWSYSHKAVRFNVPIGISYKSDPEEAIALIIEATKEVDIILKDPEPTVVIKGFGDSSVDLEARIWILEPKKGVGLVRSDLYLEVWKKFKKAGIEIPFPQRDLHIRSDEARIISKNMD